MKRLSSKEFNQELIHLTYSEPFFCDVSRIVRKVESTETDTAKVFWSGKEFVMEWNPLYFGELSSEEIRTVLKHEFYHICLGHITTRIMEPFDVWNISTDLAINSLLYENGNKFPKEALIPGYPLQTNETFKNEEEKLKFEKFSEFISSLPKKKSSEWYFEKVLDFFEENGIPASSLDDHSSWVIEEETERDYANEKLKGIVSKAISNADQTGKWGNVPLQVQSDLRKMYSNTVDWKRLLSYFFGSILSSNKINSIKKINRKYPYIHSGKRRIYHANLGIFIDQSGSVSDQVNSSFFSELENLSKRVSFTVYFFDTEVDIASKFKWTKGKSVVPLRTRNGGTNFSKVIRYINGLKEEKFDGILILTDGQCEQPPPCNVKLGWVLCPNSDLLFQARNSEFVIKMVNSQ